MKAWPAFLTVAFVAFSGASHAEEPAAAPGPVAATVAATPAAPPPASSPSGTEDSCGPQCAGGISLTAVGGVGVLGGAIMLPVAFALQSNGGDGDLVMDTTSMKIAGGATLGIGAALLTVGVILLATDSSNALPKATEPRGEPFAIDTRPVAVAPRYWLGEL